MPAGRFPCGVRVLDTVSLVLGATDSLHAGKILIAQRATRAALGYGFGGAYLESMGRAWSPATARLLSLPDGVPIGAENRSC